MIKFECVTTPYMPFDINKGFSYCFEDNSLTYLYSSNINTINNFIYVITGHYKQNDGNLYIDEYSLSKTSNYFRINYFKQSGMFIDKIDEYEENLTVYKALKFYKQINSYDNKTFSIEDSLLFFDILQLKNKKIKDLSSKQKINFIFSKIKLIDKKNIIINVSEFTNKNNEDLMLFENNINKINQEKTIIILCCDLIFFKKNETIINFDLLGKQKILKLETININNTKEKKPKIRLSSFIFASKLFFSKYKISFLIQFLLLIFLLVSWMVILDDWTSFDGITKIQTKQIIEMTFIIILTILYCLYNSFINFRIIRYNQKRKNTFCQYYIPKQIMFSYLPIATMFLTICSFILASIIKIILVLLISNTLYFPWLEIMIVFSTIFFYNFFTSIYFSLRLVSDKE